MFESLRHTTTAEIHTDTLHKRIYSVDASIFEVEPLAVIIPKTLEDLVKILEFSAKQGLPVIARGAGSGIAGGCIGKGIIVDLSKYLNRIIEINIEEGYAIVEPGVIQDRLNEALSSYGYRLGPNTSTGNRATIGGMVGNNSAGSHSLIYGQMADAVLEIDLALAGGEILRFGPSDEQTWNQKCSQNDREGAIYSLANTIRKEYEGEIRMRFAPIPRRATGYNLHYLLRPFPLNICHLIVGSEGSFGIATRIKVAITKKHKSAGVCVLHFHEKASSLNALREILAEEPIAVEMIDDKILESALRSPVLKDQLSWLEGRPEMLLVVESTHLDQLKKIAESGYGYAAPILTDPILIQQVWNVRKTGLGLLLAKRSYSRAISFIEDLSIPPERLHQFIPEFLDYLRSQGKEAGIYGHAGSGCIHIRPYIDMRDEAERELMLKISTDVAHMTLRYGGALSGEHGDGYTRSWLNEMMYGSVIYNLFKQLKRVFDPHHLMNPDKVVNGPPLLQNLRNDKPLKEFETFLDFSDEGGLALSADMCNGNSACRKHEGTMCPSFQATRDEFDTTRARAQTLRGIFTGRLKGDLASQDLNDVLDLCLSCKGCKKECPSQVDMAKMKAEATYQYQEKHGYSLRTRLMSNPAGLYKMAANFPKVFNAIKRTRLSKWIFEKLGITENRALPDAAETRFSSWFSTYTQPSYQKRFALFLDTFTEFNEPSIGISAVKVFNALGYNVELIPFHCCGRPMISKGMLREAKKQAMSMRDHLAPWIERKVPIITLEPSCNSALIDDYKGLIGETFPTQTLSEFLNSIHWNESIWNTTSTTVKVHGHCHQKALIGMGPTLKVLSKLPGVAFQEIPSGCCGVAGSFGYEKEHYEISMKIGNLVLIPAVKESDATILADGTSCRHQIAHGAHKKALHLAEFLYSKLAS